MAERGIQARVADMTPTMDYAPCKGCGKPILWATDDKGQNIPLDPRAPVYRVHKMKQDFTCERDVLVGDAGGGDSRCMVSHFNTCPTADQFSRGRRA